ncbi:hypothetical protein M153_446000884 [Pseudoloma neurophilia]|uniref:Uncharacterized protein n=1 Tax=Pseudoloma neurophilia TaxID=146866 RepID=A0A0R0LXD4_9MICR|nr:hypothetical protein M153_446000884 [Pseudoloma neurophilia]
MISNKQKMDNDYDNVDVKVLIAYFESKCTSAKNLPLIKPKRNVITHVSKEYMQHLDECLRRGPRYPIFLNFVWQITDSDNGEKFEPESNLVESDVEHPKLNTLNPGLMKQNIDQSIHQDSCLMNELKAFLKFRGRILQKFDLKEIRIKFKINRAREKKFHIISEDTRFIEHYFIWIYKLAYKSSLKISNKKNDLLVDLGELYKWLDETQTYNLRKGRSVGIQEYKLSDLLDVTNFHEEISPSESEKHNTKNSRRRQKYLKIFGYKIKIPRIFAIDCCC